MTARFLRIHIENWRSIQSLDFAPEESLTWLVGDNGSGKSSLLDGIALLGDLTRLEVADALKPRMRLRGDMRLDDHAAYFGDPARPAQWEVEFVDERDTLWRYELALALVDAGLGPKAQVIGERLFRRGDTQDDQLIDRNAAGARVVKAFNGEPSWTPLRPSAFTTLLRIAADPLEYADVAGARRFLEGLWLVALDPQAMRAGRDYVHGQPMDRYGADLEGFIRHVVRHHPEDIKGWREDGAMLGWTAVRETSHGVVYEERGRTLPLAAASDGQLVTVWLSALASFPLDTCTVLLLDEPAVAMSYRAARSLGHNVTNLSDVYQVLGASHSAEAINPASRRQIFLVERTDRGTEVRRMIDDPRLAKIWPGSPTGEAAIDVLRFREPEIDEPEPQEG